MTADIDVALHSAGQYWQAVYYDLNGRRRKRSIGAKSKVSAREARKRCRAMAAKLSSGSKTRAARLPAA